MIFYKRMSEETFDVLLWVLQYFVIYFKTQILEKIAIQVFQHQRINNKTTSLVSRNFSESFSIYSEKQKKKSLKIIWMGNIQYKFIELFSKKK